MLIRPPDFSPPPPPAEGVGRSSRSMDRDARERTFAEGRGAEAAPDAHEKAPEEKQESAGEHILDECA